MHISLNIELQGRADACDSINLGFTIWFMVLSAVWRLFDMPGRLVRSWHQRDLTNSGDRVQLFRWRKWGFGWPTYIQFSEYWAVFICDESNVDQRSQPYASRQPLQYDGCQSLSWYEQPVQETLWAISNSWGENLRERWKLARGHSRAKAERRINWQWVGRFASPTRLD